MTALDRLLTRLVVQDDGCWIWQGAHNRDGYGMIGYERTQRGVHRLAYELLVGPIPEGLEIDHLCAVRDCANPLHLEPVTRTENLRRIAERRTHCPKGHVYDEANTYSIVGRSGRVCRICRRDNGRRRYHERKAALAVAS